MACTMDHPCGGEIVPDVEFNRTMQKEGIPVRRGQCRLGAHSFFAFRIYVTECLHDHASGQHTLSEVRECGVCKVRHAIPGCSVCKGSTPASREEYEATLPRVTDGGHVVASVCARHQLVKPCEPCEAENARRRGERVRLGTLRLCGCGQPVKRKATRYCSAECRAKGQMKDVEVVSA